VFMRTSRNTYRDSWSSMLHDVVPSQSKKR
jgi:hypothetical protein